MDDGEGLSVILEIFRGGGMLLCVSCDVVNGESVVVTRDEKLMKLKFGATSGKYKIFK